MLQNLSFNILINNQCNSMNHHQILCKKAISHMNHSCEGICLHENCFARPYVCRRCVEKQHQGHPIFNFILFQQMNTNGTITNNIDFTEVADFILHGKIIRNYISLEKMNFLRKHFELECHKYPSVFSINSDNRRMVDENLEEGEVVMNNSTSVNNHQRREQAMEEQQKVEQQEYPENNHYIRFNQDPIPERMIDQNQEEPKNQEMSKIILHETKEFKINQALLLVEANKVTELTIFNSATPCAINEASAIQISKMTKLKKLKIYWSRGLSEQLAKMMTKQMTDLEELCLSQFSNCSQSFVDALKTNNLKLKKINFTVDSNHFVKYNEENIEFITDLMSYFVPEKQWVSMSKGIQDLSTLELNFPKDLNYWIGHLSNHRQTLKGFTLTADKGISPKGYLQHRNYTKIMEALQNCVNLECLKFQQITFNKESLEKVFNKNRNLLSFVASECPQIDDSICEKLSRLCRNLQELSIQLNQGFMASSLHRLTSLKTLVLRHCKSVRQQNLIAAFRELQQLECLCLDYNAIWITRQTIQALSLLPNLRVLNISNNNLTAHDIQPLKKLRHLDTLICTNNRFSYTDLLDCDFGEGLRKLSIGKNTNIFQKEYEEIKMNFIQFRFPNLTHLKLTGFKKFKPQLMPTMDKLICLTLDKCFHHSVKKARKFCQQKDIYFNC